MVKIYIGTTGWGYPFWKGQFYPSGITSQLEYYASKSPINEINSTFYAIPSEAVVSSWHDKTPKDFQFSSKLVQTITHQIDYEIQNELLFDYFSSMARLKDKLKFILYQFPKSFIASPETSNFLNQSIKKGLECIKTFKLHSKIVVELRNSSWYEDEELVNNLAEKQITIANSFIENIPTKLKTHPIKYLRILGDRSLITDEELGKKRLDKRKNIQNIAQTIAETKGETDIFYIFFNNRFSGNAIEDAILLHKELIKLELKPIGFAPDISLDDFF